MEIRTTRNTLVAAAVFAVLSGVSTLSHANLPSDSHESVRVSYSDLDLQKTEGQETLYERLRRAADDVCEEEYSRLEERECRANALDRAVEEVGNKAVTALHRS